MHTTSMYTVGEGSDQWKIYAGSVTAPYMIVIADTVTICRGALVFRNRTGIVTIIARGSWTRVERIIDGVKSTKE